MAVAKPIVLLILDGWGYRAESADNAIALANLPNWHGLLGDCPHTLIHTEGKFVGLPDGQMGNSEVGHMNIGAGRIVYQDLTRIDAAIEDGSFNENPALLAAIDAAKARGNACSHGPAVAGRRAFPRAAIFAFLSLAKRRGAGDVQVHAFLDGRDMPPQSAEPSLRALEALCRAGPEPHRHGYRPLLRHGPRQTLGAHGAGIPRHHPSRIRPACRQRRPLCSGLCPWRKRRIRAGHGIAAGRPRCRTAMPWYS